MTYMIKIIRKWESHKRVPCQGQWLYKAIYDSGLKTCWLTEREYKEWKESHYFEAF